MFDGVSLKGWKQPGKVFRVEEGAIVGGSLEKAIGRNPDMKTSEELLNEVYRQKTRK